MPTAPAPSPDLLIAQADELVAGIGTTVRRMRDAIAPMVGDGDLEAFSRHPAVRAWLARHPALDRALVAAEAAMAGRRVIAQRCAAAMAALRRDGEAARAEAAWWLAQAEQVIAGLGRARSTVQAECERALRGEATVWERPPIRR